jgi:outer membrane protein TolC
MNPFSIDDGVGAGFSRDLEGRESVNLMFALELPLFRQSHEVAGAQARVDAAEAALAEAMRVSHLERRERVRALESALTQLKLARDATRASNIAITSMRAAYAAGEVSGISLQKALAEHAVRMQATADAAVHESEARAAYERALLIEIATTKSNSHDLVAHGLVAHGLVAGNLVAQSTQARESATGDAP